jgi:hypothetical protein
LEDNDLNQFLYLIEDSNIEYDVLLGEIKSRGIKFMGLEEYRDIRKGKIEGELFDRVMKVLEIREYIRKDDSDYIIPLRPNLIGQGRQLNDGDKAFGRQLLDEFGNVDKILSEH